MRRVLFSALLAFMMVGCGNDTSNDVTLEAPYEAGGYIVFDAAGGDIPYPNNILFAANSSSTNDADDVTLNIPYEPSDSDASVKYALNELNGFSTTSPITVSFNGEINASSLYGNIHLYEIGDSGIASELTFHVPNLINGDYIATTSGSKIVILPVKPLKSATNYAVVLTNGIVDNNNKPIAPDVASELLLRTTALVDATGNHTNLSIDDATTFESIRQLTQQMIGLTLAYDTNIKREDIVSAWNFKTQSIGDIADAFATNNPTGAMGLADTNLTSKDIIASTGADVSSMYGIAKVYAGTLSNVPYYLAKARSKYDTAPLTNSFEFNASSSLPELNATISIPVLATVPNTSAMPTDGWPVVIFQHGITQNRTNLLAISEALANAGYAAVAIDLPLHGIDDNTSGLYLPTLERTFDLDLVNNTTLEAGPDGVIDPSGTHYINLASLLTSRDNVRQTTSDLIALQNSFGSVVATDGLKFDASKVAFVGHSLGTIASFGYLAHTTLEGVTLAMPGGGIAQLLNNSASFGPIIEAGLASKGIIKGSAEYDAFMLATQTVLDDADPINYAMIVGATQNIFAIEVVGNGTEGTSDQVIPNSVATAPLSGTEPLLTYMQTENLTASASVKPNKVARFTVGDHSSILDPSASVSATVEMQTQTASFVNSTGSYIQVNDASLLYNP